MKRSDRQQPIRWPRGMSTAFVAALLFSIPAIASAQTSSYAPATDNVVINWAAIGDGAAPVSSIPSTAQRPGTARPGGLLMPGPVTPRSQLHVPAPGGVTLRQPRPAAPRTTPSVAPRPASAPAPSHTATATPAPAPTPAPAATAAPAPPPAPATPVETASAPPAPAAPEPVASAPAAPAAPPAPPETSAAPPPPPVAPEVAAAPTTPPSAPEQAAVPPADDGPAQVLFNDDDTRLSADGQGILDAVIGQLERSERLRVQLMAYASGEDLTSSKARRISLSRALSVRSYLIEKGVRSTRIDVRALGDKAESDPKNRVDVNILER